MKGIKTIYDVGAHEKVIKTIYVIRNTATTFISIAVAIGITAQGEVRTGQRIVDIHFHEVDITRHLGLYPVSGDGKEKRK